jgi:hypothetical protein
MDCTVQVLGKPVKVTVRQKSKRVWLAAGVWVPDGEYMGEHIAVSNSTPESAVSLWRKVAEYRGG